MRVSTGMIYNRLLGSMDRNLQAIDRSQQNLSSGLRINRPSDDPTGIYMAMGLKSRVAIDEGYQRNIMSAESVLEGADSAVIGAKESVTRAYELAVQFANGTYSEEDRRLGVKEIEEIQKEIVALGNKKVGDRYIFGGYQTNSPPYAQTIRITDGVNDQIVFNDGSGAPLNTFTADLAAGFYAPDQLAAEVKRALEAASATPAGFGHEYSVDFDYVNNTFSIANQDTDNTADTLTLRWSDAASTAADALGFDANNDVVATGNVATGERAVTYETGFEITASNNVLMADFGAGAVAVTLSANAYSGADLAAEIETQLEAADAGDTYTVTYDSGGMRFQIRNDAGNDGVTLAWSDPATTLDTVLGFTADDTLAAGETAAGDLRANLTPRYVYQGDQGLISVPAGPSGSSIIMNIPGNELFDDALLALDGLIDAMYTDDQPNVQASIDELNSSLEALFGGGAKLGGRLNRLEHDKDRIEQEDLETKAILSEVQDSDVIEETINLSRYQTALESLRAAGFQQISKSLFDFLQ